MGSRLAAVIVLLFFLALAPSLSHASSTSPEYSFGVTDKAVSVSMNLNLSQNLTAFDRSFSLPQLHSVLEGSNSTTTAGAIQDALQARNHSAYVSDLRLEVETTAWSNITGLQWFNISLTMKVTGVATLKSGGSHVDLSWKSFNVSSDIPLGGVEVNNVGEKLLLKVASNLAGQTSSNPSIRFLFFVRNVQVGAPSFPSVVAGLRTLSFSTFAAPISTWKETYDALAQTSTWTLNPSGVFLGMTFEEQTQEAARVTETLVYQLSSTLSGKIVGPGSFSVNGDTLTIPVNNLPETLMGVIILSISTTLVGATIYERKVLNRPMRKRPKR